MADPAPISQGIVVGIELDAEGRALSAGSELAVREAGLLADRFDLPVTLVHSTAVDERWNDPTEEYVHREPLEADGRKALEAAAEGLRAASVDARLVVSETHSVVAIVEQAARSGADLVLVGKRSIEAKDGRRLGSVSRTLIHDCPVAVWVVRPSVGAGHACILAAADLTPVGERVVRAAARVAQALGSELHVVHAFALTLEAQLESDAERERYIEDRRREAEEQLRAWLGGVRATLHVGLTSPTQAVLAGVRRLDPDLVVMGTVSRHGIPGLILGNTAERLLDRLDASLFVVKPEPAGER